MKGIIMHPTKKLVAEIIQKSASMKKTADFPAILMSMGTQDRDNISRQYSIGPRSDVREIPVDNVTKKPYSEGLIVYTTSVLSEKEQREASREKQQAINSAMRELEETQEYKDLHGSQAGRKMWEAKNAEVTAAAEKQIAEKYKPKERIVAWGVGTYFSVNSNLFSYHWRGRSRGSDAPNNRKALIEYIKTNGGKSYFVTKDPDVETARRTRQERRPVDPGDQTRSVIRERSKAYGRSKKVILDTLIHRAIHEVSKKVNQNLETIADKIKTGRLSGYSNFGNEILQQVSFGKLSEIGQVYYEINNAYGSSTREELLAFMRKINNLIADLSKKPAEEVPAIPAAPAQAA
jgi:hypothetical protein